MTLGFVTVNGPDQFTLWDADLQNGADLADSCVDFMRDHESPSLLGQIAKAQIKVGAYGPTEISFWHRMAERLSA